MLKMLHHRLLATATLLTFICQLVLANGLLMVPRAHAQEAVVELTQNTVADSHAMHSAHTKAAETSTMHCHQTAASTPQPMVEQPQTEEDCCSEPMPSHLASAKTNDSSHCCDGDNQCQSDCSHCLVISIAGTLLDLTPWSSNPAPESPLASVIPHFHSIALAQDIRPPIA
ncbi:hypothetical protein G3R49_00930 [Shewanella sp. WXL01]|nr:hypothetical protein [Shewanella sp. WXL01]